MSAAASSFLLPDVPLVEVVHVESRPDAIITSLYFSAGWCPDCIGVSPLLKIIYDQERANAANESRSTRFDVIHVTSDTSAEEMIATMEKSHGLWRAVAFEGNYRTELKVKFRTCAAKEMASIGLESRDHGIPTLICFGPGGMSDLITTSGVEDIQALGVNAIDSWIAQIDARKGAFKGAVAGDSIQDITQGERAVAEKAFCKKGEKC